mgnify:CR=1 FL=1
MARAMEAACALVAVPTGSTWLNLGGALLEPLLECTFVVSAHWLLSVARGEVSVQKPNVIAPWQVLPPEAGVSLAGLRASTERARATHNKLSKPAGNSGTTVFISFAFSHHGGKATKGFAFPRAAQWSQHLPSLAAWIFCFHAAFERWERGCHEMN